MLHHVFSCLLRAKVIAQRELSSRSCSFDVPTLLLPFSICIFCNRADPSTAHSLCCWSGIVQICSIVSGGSSQTAAVSHKSFLDNGLDFPSCEEEGGFALSLKIVLSVAASPVSTLPETLRHLREHFWR